MKRKEPTILDINSINIFIFVLLIHMSATSTMQEHGHASWMDLSDVVAAGRLDNDTTCNSSPTGGGTADVPSRPSGRRRAPRRRSTDILAREDDGLAVSSTG